MKKQKFNLRNVVAIAICLVVAITSFSCKKESNGKNDKSDDNSRIISFVLRDDNNETYNGVIYEDRKLIHVRIPFCTCPHLTPIITVSAGATVNPPSGVINFFDNAIQHPGKRLLQSFTPVQYTVTGKNGSKSTYDVYLTESYYGSGTVEIEDLFVASFQGATFNTGSAGGALPVLSLHQGWIWGDYDEEDHGIDLRSNFSIDFPDLPKLDTIPKGTYFNLPGSITIASKSTYVTNVDDNLTVNVEYDYGDGLANLCNAWRQIAFCITITGVMWDISDPNHPKKVTISAVYVGPVWWSGI